MFWAKQSAEKLTLTASEAKAGCYFGVLLWHASRHALIQIDCWHCFKGGKVSDKARSEPRALKRWFHFHGVTARVELVPFPFVMKPDFLRKLFRDRSSGELAHLTGLLRGSYTCARHQSRLGESHV